MRGKLQAALNMPKDIAQARFEGCHIFKIRSSWKMAYVSPGLVLQLGLKEGEITVQVENEVAETVAIDNLSLEVKESSGLGVHYSFISLVDNLEMIIDA